VQAIALDSGNSFGENRGAFQLSLRAQIATGIAIIAVLVGSFILSESLIPIAVILGAFVVFATVRNPVASLFAFIVINVFLTLHGKDTGEATGTDLALGVVIVLIMAYWLVRIRIFELDSMSTSKAQLLLFLFAIWSGVITMIGLFGEHTSFTNALREMLNLSPLVALPIIYSRFIKLESRAERLLFAGVLAAAIFMVIWNFLRMRSNVLHAVYLYQTGRGNSDEMLSGLLVLLATSLLMTVRGFWKAIPPMLLLMLGVAGVVMSFARTLYIVAILCMVVVLLLGNSEERWRGIKRLLTVGLATVIAVIPIYFSSRIFRLLLWNYGMRFISTQHLGTDLSLRMRYVEWKYEWLSILQSPILGHGFGAQFRIFDILWQDHSWMTYSHSSYLYMIFKTGFIGAGLFFGAYLSFGAKGLRLLKFNRLPVQSRILLRAGVGYLMAMLIYAYTAPVLDSKTDLIWVGLIVGYFLVIERHVQNKAFVPTNNPSLGLV
jgi:O-antigen ligase